MKVVLTGALGHLGSKLLKDLPKDYEITAIDNFLCQRYSSLYNLDRRIRFIEADITTTSLEELFKGIDVVIHLAAITDASSTVNNEAETFRVNLGGTERVARACAVNGCRLFVPSTTSVYGKSDFTVDETCQELSPQSPYADSKLQMERMLATIPNLKYVIGRCGTIFGISEGMRWHTFVNKACWLAATQRPITVWRTALHQVRPYLYLGDFLLAINHIISKDLFNGETYNILTGNYTPFEITKHIKRYRPDVEIVLTDSSIMNLLTYSISCLKFIKTGWIAKGDLPSGIAETMDLLRGLHG